MAFDETTSRKAIPILLGASVLLFTLFICAQPAFITDLWWQLRLGDQIRITHHIPTHDAFSWTCRGRPIVLHEWGSYVIFAESFRHLGGWQGVWILEAMVCSITMVGLYGLILSRIPKHPFIALFLTIFAGHTIGQFLSPRPQIFTYLCFIFSLGILFRCRSGRHSLILPLILLAVCQVFWANMHAAAPGFIALCIIYGIGDGIQGLANKNSDADAAAKYRRASLASLSCAAISVAGMIVNPSGIGIFRIIFDTVGDKTMPNTIGEWVPINFHDNYGHAMESFLLLIAFSITSKRAHRDLGDFLGLLLLCLASLDAVRNIALLGLGGSFILAPYTVGATQSFLDRYPKLTLLRSFGVDASPAFALTAAVLFAGVFTVGIIGTARAAGEQGQPATLENVAENAYEITMVPEDGCRFIEAEKIPTTLKLYNDYNIGAYLIWRLPQYPVFTSTETFVYFGPVLQTYMGLDSLPYNWREVLAPYQPDLVMTTTADIQLHLFINAPDWAMVYAGGLPNNDPKRPITFIFIRRTPANEPVITRCRAACPMVQVVKAKGYWSAA